jgi:drug/metabolite transporter (DMT)-like permease
MTLNGRVLAAYMVVALVWGSTYLAIRIGVQRLPPALFGGMRFLAAGTVLLLLALALGKRLPSRPKDWVTAAVVGIMLLAVGNGGVIWAEQWVESGTVAILIVTGALMMALFDAVIPGSDARPTWRQFVALLIGFGGTVLLVGGNPASLGEAGWVGPLVVIVAAASWSLGSIYSKRNPAEASPYVFSALQMLFGGAVLAVVGLASGEAAELSFSLAGLGAVLYLIVFGSIVAFTSYVYLLRHAPPAFVGTTVYVNTVVAVLLGWVVLAEHVSVKTFFAMAIILGSVVWVRRATPQPEHPSEELQAAAE